MSTGHRINAKGQEVNGGKPLTLAVKGLQRPLSPREEMQRMIVDYDAQKRRARIAPDPNNDDDLIRDHETDEVDSLTDAEMEYQLSAAESAARAREARQAAQDKYLRENSPSKPIQDPPDPDPSPDPKKDPGPPTK